MTRLLTQEQIDFLIEFFREAGLTAREQEGEVWVTGGVGNVTHTVVIEKATQIPLWGDV